MKSILLIQFEVKKSLIQPWHIVLMLKMVCVCIFTFRYSFIQPIYDQCFRYIPLRTTEEKPLVFWGSQMVWCAGGCICQKWVNHLHGSWYVGISLVDVFRQCKQICKFPVDFHGFS